METPDVFALVAPGKDEDSVDIYEDLDFGLERNPEEMPSVKSELKDSMDLYEDIVLEEQLNRESSYSEFKSRFEAAQRQIKELHRRLGQMELQNTGLRTENIRLKKNISALLQTARQEVVRKDAEIQRLNQWASTACSSARLLPPHHLNSQSKEEPPPADSPHPNTKEAFDLNNSIKPFPHSHSEREHDDGDNWAESDRHGSREREDKSESQKLSESTDKRLRSFSHHIRVSDQKQAHKEDKDSGHGYSSRSHKNWKYEIAERHCRSSGTKTPSEERLYNAASPEHEKKDSKVQRTDKAKRVSLDHDKIPGYQSGGSCRPEYRKITKSHRYDRRFNSKDIKCSSLDASANRCGDGTKERERNRHRDHQGSVDRRYDDDIRKRHHRRHSQTDRSRERKKQRAKQSAQLDVDKMERREKKAVDVKRTSEKPNPDTNISLDDNISNRKLSFMEILNLTLSPIKTYGPPRDSSPEELLKDDDDTKDSSTQEKPQPNIDEMCVIDELNSELEAEPEHVPEQSTEDLKASSNDKISNKFDEEDVKENVKNGNESPHKPVVVLSGSPKSQAQCTAGDEGTVLCTTPSSQNSSMLQAIHSTGGNNIKDCEEQPVHVSNNQKTEHCRLDVTESSLPSEASLPSLERHKTTEQTPQLEHGANRSTDVTEATAVSLEKTPPQSLPQDTAEESSTPPLPKDINDNVDTSEESRTTDEHFGRAVSPSRNQQGLCLPSSTNVTHEKDPFGQQECSKDLDSVSSTICVDSFPQEGLSLTEASYVITQTHIDTSDCKNVTSQPNSSVGCIGVSKVSSTTEEDMSPEEHNTPTVTPKKICSRPQNVDPSSSVSLPHDEDSMMHTLSNLKRIPEAISPLRSPVQMAKRSVLHVHSKFGHVKSLQKEFSTSAVETISKKLDINKENKYPGSPANQDTQNMVSEQASSQFDTELEEGEILSESDDATSNSPHPATKRPKLTEPARNKASPTSLRKKVDECRISPKEPQESAASSTQSPRSRFKTVCPAGSKASFSTVEEVMETFKLVRAEMRKKYMKLHKTFPKKSFYGVMDNFQKSFVEFVDGAQFGQICSEAKELKSKLRKLIASVFNKVLNNGIVKRIFEQQAVNLKQKLWDFVDTQVDYLLMDIHTTLKSLCQPMSAPTDKKASGESLESQEACVKKLHCKQNESHSPNSSRPKAKSSALVPYRTGLGSRGKDIRMSHTEKKSSSHALAPEPMNTQAVANHLSLNSLPPSPEKDKISSLVISQSGSILDRPDFELLTEQQASSLTFNLVRDSQMGEIFKCLLQGSDLLESTGMSGENTAWSIGTPRKDGERFLGFTTPSKFLSPPKSDTSSRLITTWSSISPQKRSSPCTKNQIPLNPALFDESCLLEVPSGNRMLPHGSLAAEKSYSILAEDLAVSLTIPSPLKSDSHLSFLQSADTAIQVLSTPDSVINAHISEDALLDGEDATEQDIHLALDSCSSEDGTTSHTPISALVFKPDVPMQALVMEKSNDHFIVKIRQMNKATESMISERSISQTPMEQVQHHNEDEAAQEHQNVQNHHMVLPSDSKLCLIEGPVVCKPSTRSDTHEERENLPQSNPSEQRRAISTQSEKAPHKMPSSDDPLNTSFLSSHSAKVTDDVRKEFRVEVTPPKAMPFKLQKQFDSSGIASSSCVLTTPSSPNTNPDNRPSQTLLSESSRDETNGSESEKSLSIDTSSSSEKSQRCCEQLRKRKRRHEKLEANRAKKEKSFQEASPSETLSAALSPSSLSAKNIIRKKGEVVIAWTRKGTSRVERKKTSTEPNIRDEDRSILMYLKTKGASRETFSALSEKLNKPSGEIAHRFHQLMKLFKKQEKMDT